MRVTLGVATALAGVIFASQVIAYLTVALWLFLIVGASYVSVKTGGLTADAVRLSMTLGGIAAGTALLMATKAAATGRQSRAPAVAEGSHPYWFVSLVLGALTVVMALVSQTNSRPLDIAAISAAFAFTYLIAFLGPILLLRLTWRVLGGLYTAGTRSQWLAGALTATFALLALVGGWSIDVHAGAFAAIEAEEATEPPHYPELEQNPPGGLEGLHLAAICITADHIVPEVARDRRKAPGCAVLGTSSRGATGSPSLVGGGTFNDCIEQVFEDENFQGIVARLESKYRLDTHDAYDVAVAAAMEICEREDIHDPRAYFRAAADHAALKAVRRQRKQCELMADDIAVDPWARDDAHAERLRKEQQATWAWRYAACNLDERAWQIVRLRSRGLSFAEIARRVRTTEDDARYRYNNAKRMLKNAMASELLIE